MEIIDQLKTPLSIRGREEKKLGYKKAYEGDIHKIASGLNLKLKVLFRGNAEAKDFHDRLRVTFGDHVNEAITIPLCASPPKADIVYESRVDMGTAILNNTITNIVEIKNQGSREGLYEIKFDQIDSRLTVVPAQGVLAPKGTKGSVIKLKFRLTSPDAGPARFVGKVTFPNSNQPAGVIDVFANVVEQRLQLIDGNAGNTGVDEIFFGNLFFGQRRVLKYKLVNNSPVASNFSVYLRPRDKNEKNSDSSNDENGDDGPRDNEYALVRNPDMQCMPAEGRIDPYQSVELSFIFRPNPDTPDQHASSGFKSQRTNCYVHDYEYMARVESGQTNQVIKVPMSAKGVEPYLVLSEAQLNFNECPVHERRDSFITIQNKAEKLPMRFHFEKLAHFTMKPMRGLLRPLQSMDIKLSFLPRQLGTWNTTFKLILGDNIKTYTVPVQARSTTIAARPNKAKGIQALPVDFKPEVTYVKPLQKREKFNRQTGWKNRSLTETYTGQFKVDADSLEAEMTYTMDQVQNKTQNREKYDSYLKTCRQQRLKKTSKSSSDVINRARLQHKKVLPAHGLPDLFNTDPMDPVSLGMPFASGLNSPRPKLPPATEVVWLQYPMAGYDGISKRGMGLKLRRSAQAQIMGENQVPGDRSVGGPTGNTDVRANKLMKRKPTTQAERRDCETRLTHEDLLNITKGPRLLDYGRMVIKEVGRKIFSVSNDLEQHILVELDLKDPEISKTRPKSQMIPPGEIADFPIVFMSTDPQPEFRTTVNYTINKTHNFSFTVTAEVSPMSVTMSIEEAHFAFGKDNATFSVVEPVTLTNPSNVQVKYDWSTSSANSAFRVLPQSGTIEAYKSAKCDICYEPAYAQDPFDEEIALHIKDGPSKKLLCHAALPVAEAIFRPKRINLGPTSIGNPISRTFQIVNTGNSRTIFAFEDLSHGFVVTPSHGLLETGGSQTLTLSFFPRVAKEIRAYLNCKLRGANEKAKTLRILVGASPLVPELRVLEDEVDFQGVTIGTTGRKPLTIENESKVSVTMYLDLTKYPEFSLQYPKSWDQLEQPPVTRIPTAQIQIQQQRRQSMMANRTVRGNFGSGDETQAIESFEEEMAYQLNLKPESKLDLALLFTPTSMMEYAFELPLQLFGIPSYPSIRRVLAGKGLKPKITLSDNQVDFGNRVVLKKERRLRNPYIKRFEMKNEESYELHWSWKPAAQNSFLYGNEFVGDDVETKNPSPPHTSRSRLSSVNDDYGEPPREAWRVEPTSGVLLPGQTCTVAIYFSPTDPRVYEHPIDLFFQGQETQKPYLSMSIIGAGTYPMLTFDRNEVILPIVPLNIRSSTTFYVYNQGYDNLELHHHFPQDTSNAPLHIEFPDGASLGVGRQSVPVKVWFQSKKSISFSTRIEFTDVEGNGFSVPITGSTDNSLLTVQPFLDMNQHGGAYYINSRDGGPITLTPGENMRTSIEPPKVEEKKEEGELEKTKKLRSPKLTDRSTFSDEEGVIEEDEDADVDVLETVNIDDSLFNSIEAVLNYVSASNLVDNPHLWTLEYFPDFIVRTSGEIVFDLIRKITGKNLKRNPIDRGTRAANKAKINKSSRLNTAGSAGGAMGQDPNAANTDADAIQPPSSPGAENNAINGVSIPPATAASARVGTQNSIALLDAMDPETGADFEENSTGKTPVIHVYENYLKLLLFLRSHGALLHTVKPQFMLSLPQYLRLKASGQIKNFDQYEKEGQKDMLLNSSNSQQHREAHRRRFESKFPSLSGETWLTILHQIIRCFILNRVTPRSYAQLPGLPDDSVPSPLLPAFQGSNVYSTNECVLLKWMQVHCNEVHSDTLRKIDNFDSDLKDGVVLSGVLLSHIPNLNSLSAIDLNAKSYEECLENCLKVVAALQEIGLQHPISAEAIAEPTGRDMVMLVLYLYQTLPAFIPKTTIEFKGRLHDVIEKTIELTNPTKKPIHYTVTLDGSPDFTVEQYNLSLEPKGKSGSTAKFTIRFKSRFSKSVQGRLVFSSDRGGSASSSTSSSTIVFLLSSLILSRKSIRTHTMITECYKPQYSQLEITNIFGKDCRFSLAVNVVSEPPVHKVKKSTNKDPGMGGRRGSNAGMQRRSIIGGRGGVGNTKRNKRRRGSALASELMHPPAFFTKHDMIKIKAGETVAVPFEFLPMRMGEYKCQLIFLDEFSGEFMHEIVGTAEKPPVFETIKFSQQGSKQSTTNALHFPASNHYLGKVRQTTLARINQLTNKQKIALRVRPDWPRQILRADYLPPIVHYTVQISSPFFTCSAPHVVLDASRFTEEEKQNSSKSKRGAKSGMISDRSHLHGNSNSNSKGGRDSLFGGDINMQPSAEEAGAVDLLFTPKGPGLYRTEVCLVSPYDVRMYNVEMTVTPEKVEPELELASPVRQALSQDIPIYNGTDEQWTLRALLQGSKMFTGSNDLVVPPRSTAHYTVTFKPNWICKVNASLELSNIRNSDSYTYQLVGVGEEPLAEDIIQIECQARATVEHTLKVKNYDLNDAEYTIESDIPHIHGDSKIRVHGKSTANYTLKVSPQLSGLYSGTVSFIDEKGKFVWFAVEIKVSSPAPEATLDIKSFIRKAAAVEINVTNPLDEVLEFAVDLQAEGLFGDASMTLGPKETGAYQFMFAPLAPGVQEGAISFSNSKAGEFWYKLNLVAEHAEPIVVEEMTAEVGQTTTTEITLENPTEEEIVMRGRSSNPRNFNCKPPIVSIPPFDAATVTLVYAPSSIEQEEKGVLNFKHPAAGQWTFHMKGKGSKPKAMDETVIHSAISTSLSTMVTFRNPFNARLPLHIEMRDDTGAFKLFRKKPQATIAPFALLQIPFVFLPKLMQTHNARILVTTPAKETRRNRRGSSSSSSNDDLVWTFPLKGVAEGPSTEAPIELQCQARGRLDDTIELKLPGMMPGQLPRPEKFTLDIECADRWKSFLQRALTTTVVNPTLTHGATPLSVRLSFIPLRPASLKLTLVVEKESGGRWKYPVHINVSDPPVDEVLTIQALLNQTSSLSFRITNQFDIFSKFHAFFSPDSAVEFDVFPKSGILEPIGSEGTQFVVSFSPTVYGKPLVAKLIVQTEDMQWTYEIKGTHPKYQPPSGTSVINNRLSDDVSRELDNAHRIKTSSYVKTNAKTFGLRGSKKKNTKSVTGRKTRFR